MSGFSKDWLALREPADHAARDMALVTELVEHLKHPARISVLDIGSGTGSTWRGLSGELPNETSWQLLDHDPHLLEEAQRRIGPNERVRYTECDLSNFAAYPFDGISLITASALFDLCSETFCTRFVAHLADAACGFYAPLNYNGVMRWSIQHPLDDHVVDDINDHQSTDKGFGPALGPEAVDFLVRELTARDYRIRLGESPWFMLSEQAALQEAFLDGLRRPLQEIGRLSEDDIKDWLAFRHAAIWAPGSMCEVGHTDLLALPVR